MRISYLAAAVACMLSMSTGALAQSDPLRRPLASSASNSISMAMAFRRDHRTPTTHPDVSALMTEWVKTFARGQAFLTGSWDAASRGVRALSTPDTVFASSLLADFPGAGTLVFLFGEELGCCAQAWTCTVLPNGASRSTSVDRSSCSCQPLNLSAARARSLVGKEALSETAGTSRPRRRGREFLRSSACFRLG